MPRIMEKQFILIIIFLFLIKTKVIYSILIFIFKKINARN